MKADDCRLYSTWYIGKSVQYVSSCGGRGGVQVNVYRIVYTIHVGSHTVWRHTLNGDRYCMANIETLISTLYGDLANSDTLFSP